MHATLHAVAVRKHASAEAVAALLGADATQVAALLARAVGGGRAVASGGRYLLTPAGRMIVDAGYSRHCAALRRDPAVDAAHAQFEVVNDALKQVITDWQTVTVGGRRVANDHTDPDYDAGILDRLAAVHERVAPVLAALAAAEPRFGRYQTRLEAALDRAEGGERAWVSDAAQDSYHTLWFELHEDLLRVLGRARRE